MAHCTSASLLATAASLRGWEAAPDAMWLCSPCRKTLIVHRRRQDRLAKAAAAAAAEATGVPSPAVRPTTKRAVCANPRIVAFKPPKSRNTEASTEQGKHAQALRPLVLQELRNERQLAREIDDGVTRRARQPLRSTEMSPQARMVLNGFLTGVPPTKVNGLLSTSRVTERGVGNHEQTRISDRLAAAVHEYTNKMCIAKWKQYIAAVGEENAVLYVDGSWDSRHNGVHCTVTFMVRMPPRAMPQENPGVRRVGRHDIVCVVHVTKETIMTVDKRAKLVAEGKTGDDLRDEVHHDPAHRRVLVTSSSHNLEDHGIRVGIRWLQQYCGLRTVSAIVHDKCKKAFKTITAILAGQDIEDNFDLGHRLTSLKTKCNNKLGKSKRVKDFWRHFGHWLQAAVDLASGDPKALVGYLECGRRHWRNDHELCHAFALHDEHIPFKWAALVEKDHDVIEELLEVMMKEAPYVATKRNTCAVEGSNGVRWRKFLPKEKGFPRNYAMYADMAALDWQNKSWKQGVLDMLEYGDEDDEDWQRIKQYNEREAAATAAYNETRRDGNNRMARYEKRAEGQVFATSCNLPDLRAYSKDHNIPAPDDQVNTWSADLHAQVTEAIYDKSIVKRRDNRLVVLGKCNLDPSKDVRPDLVGEQLQARFRDHGSFWCRKRKSAPAVSSEPVGTPTGDASSTADSAARPSPLKRRRGVYKCRKCGKPRKGHTCTAAAAAATSAAAVTGTTDHHAAAAPGVVE